MSEQPIRARTIEQSVCAYVQGIDDCNQRGGRMLSLVDLIAAGSVDLVDMPGQQTANPT